MNRIFETDVIILRETEKTLTILSGLAPSYKEIKPDKSSTIKMKIVKIQKKHLLEGSDQLGIPVDKKDTTKKNYGRIIIPAWLAVQRGLWEKNNQEELNT